MRDDSEKSFFYPMPIPTGKYAMGKVSFSLTDPSRKEWHVKNSNANRELMVHVWYPSEKLLGSESKKLDTESDYYLKMKTLCQKRLNLNEDQCNERMNIFTFARSNAPTARGITGFPVILFSPGFEEPSESYSILLEQLVSCGYIVMGIDHPYFCSFTSLPDGRILKGGFEFYLQHSDKENQDYPQLNKYFVRELQTNVEDVQFVLNAITCSLHNPIKPQILAQMDFNKVGMMGHSCGGACSVEMARIDSRIKTAINLDGAFFGAFSIEEVKKPIMTLFTEKFLMQKSHATKKEASSLGLSVAALDTWYDSLMEERFAFCKNMGTFGSEIVLKNFAHQSIINHVFLKNESIRHLVLGDDVEKQLGTISPHKAITITTDLILTFFDKNLPFDSERNLGYL